MCPVNCVCHVNQRQPLMLTLSDSYVHVIDMVSICVYGSGRENVDSSPAHVVWLVVSTVVFLPCQLWQCHTSHGHTRGDL